MEILYSGEHRRLSRCVIKTSNGESCQSSKWSNWTHFGCKDRIATRSAQKVRGART